MRWIFENPQILLLIAGAVAYWVTQRRQKQTLRKEAQEELGRVPTDDEMGERMRRIQDEIRRKIEERQAGGQQPPQLYRSASQPGPVAAPPPLPTVETVSRPPLTVATAEAGTGAEELERVMEQQRRYSDQLQQLESLSRTAPTAINVAAAAAFSAQGVEAPVARRATGLPEGLRGRAAQRQAILLREILGPAKWQQ